MMFKCASFSCFLESGANGGSVCPVGSTLGTISVACAILGAPLSAPWAPKAVQKSKQDTNKLRLESPWAPRGAKRTPKVPQTL